MPLQPRDQPCARAGDHRGQFLRVLGRRSRSESSPLNFRCPCSRVSEPAALAGNPAGASRRPARAAASPLQPQALRGATAAAGAGAGGCASARAASGLPHRERRDGSAAGGGPLAGSGAAGARGRGRRRRACRRRRGVEALRAQYGGEERPRRSRRPPANRATRGPCPGWPRPAPGTSRLRPPTAGPAAAVRTPSSHRWWSGSNSSASSGIASSLSAGRGWRLPRRGARLASGARGAAAGGLGCGRRCCAASVPRGSAAGWRSSVRRASALKTLEQRPQRT